MILAALLLAVWLGVLVVTVWPLLPPRDEELRRAAELRR